MYLNTLSPTPGSKKKIKRVGRGIASGFGKTSGRGHKGQKSRTGGKVRIGFEGGQMPIYRRVPKFGFKSKKNKFRTEVKLSTLENFFKKIIDLNFLKEHSIVSRKIKYVKIIFDKKIMTQLTIVGINVTKGARSAIELAGGNIKN
ncbi:50S ribosomal protein L15 [Buchnera aphidicola (Neophyllaphis podocarpi)]|uniref:50S ribosomal protein L15 n=1 Tax=Buchnera aphidicola TaxID=9 RepID=UPI0031B8AAAD